MNYTVDFDNKNKFVLCTCRGMLDLASAKSKTIFVRKRVYELGYGLVYDVTNISLEVGIIDAYSFSRDEDIYDDLKHCRGKAVVVYKNEKDFWEYFETTARNAGVDV